MVRRAGAVETEQVCPEYRWAFWFLLVSWTSCNALFHASLRANSGGIYLIMKVSMDLCDEVGSHCLTRLMSKPAAYHSKLTSVMMYKHLRGVNAFVSVGH